MPAVESAWSNSGKISFRHLRFCGMFVRRNVDVMEVSMAGLYRLSGVSGRSVLILAAAIAGMAIASVHPAFADSIDGEWCSSTGRRVVIEGSRLTSPKRVVFQGDYAKYSVRFTMPEGEPDAGSAVTMVFRRGLGVDVTIGANAPQLWQKCQPGIS